MITNVNNDTQTETHIISITYSWGDEENPIYVNGTKADAIKQAFQLAAEEMYVTFYENEEYAQIDFDLDKCVITLTYCTSYGNNGYDKCFYTII